MADTERALQVRAEFPDIFRKAASDRLRSAAERHAWAHEEMMILMQSGVSAPPWMEDLWALTDPKTPIKALRAAGARLCERMDNLGTTIPELAIAFEPPKKQGPQKIEEKTLRRIKLAADLEYEGFTVRAASEYVSSHLPLEKRYQDLRTFRSKHRQKIEARVRLRSSLLKPSLQWRLIL